MMLHQNIYSFWWFLFKVFDLSIRKENGLEREREKKEEEEGWVVGFNRNENAEPIGARVFDAKSINVVRRIPNPLHRFFNPICRSFVERIPGERKREREHCVRTVRGNSTYFREAKDWQAAERKRKRERESRRKKKDPGIGYPSGAQSTWKTVPPLKDNPLT